MNESDSLPPFEELHRRARAAFQARDLESYMSVFSADLRYQQADGRIIDRDQLTRDVRRQLRALSAVDSCYRTEQVEFDAECVIETISQWAHVAASAFLFIHRLWRLDRQGRYHWRQTDHGWKICEVNVITEALVGVGFQVGRQPQLPPLTPPSTVASAR